MTAQHDVAHQENSRVGQLSILDRGGGGASPHNWRLTSIMLCISAQSVEFEHWSPGVSNLS
jgi:hypothetical protein